MCFGAIQRYNIFVQTNYWKNLAATIQLIKNIILKRIFGPRGVCVNFYAHWVVNINAVHAIYMQSQVISSPK